MPGRRCAQRTSTPLAPVADVAPKKRGHRGRALGSATYAELGADDAMRQCAVCRARRPRLALMQLKATGRAGQRHAYVCISRQCMLRAFAAGSEAEVSLQQRAEKQIRQLIGLARRAGLVLLGAGALAREPVGNGGIVFSASDAALRTQRNLPAGALPVPLTSEALGRAAGQKPVAALGLQPGRHAMQAAYWQRVWYESARDDSSRGSSKGQHTEVADE